MSAAAKVTRTPWLEAIELVGEDNLKRDEHGKPYSHQRVSNWRRDGVPAQIMLAKERQKQNVQLPPAAATNDLVAAMDTIRVGIWQAWQATGGEGTPKWEDMQPLLIAVVRMMNKKTT